jgi:hypothetical protein
LDEWLPTLASLGCFHALQVQIVLVMLYLAVLDVGTQLWASTVAALALLLLGCVWMFGDAAR